MRRFRLAWLLIPAICAAVSYWIGRENAAKIWQQWVCGAPILHCPSQFDVGERDLGSRVIVPFTIQNRGCSVLEIREVQTTCSCAGLELDDDENYPRLTSLKINGGESVSVRLKVNVGGKTGEPSAVTVSLDSNDPNQPIHPVTVHIARVHGGASWRPENVGFGEVPLGSARTMAVEIFDAGRSGRVVSHVQSDHPDRIKATFTPDKSEQLSVEGWRRLGIIDVSTDATSAGSLYGDVLVYLANESRPPDRIRIFGEVVPPLVITPSQVVLPIRASNGIVDETKCLVRRIDGADFQLEIVETAPWLKVDVESPALQKSKQYIRISKIPESTPTRDSIITLRSRRGNESIDHKIPVRWQAELLSWPNTDMPSR